MKIRSVSAGVGVQEKAIIRVDLGLDDLFE